MRLTLLILAAAAASPLGGSSGASLNGAGARPQGVERVAAAEPTVFVSLCVASGNVVVRGWGRPEVRARSRDAKEIELRRGGEPDAPARAARVEVLVRGPGEGAPGHHDDCRGGGDIELDVPRGATVQLRSRDGGASVSDVAEARVETASGNIDVRRVSKAVEAASVGGNVSLRDSRGRVRLWSSGGAVSATNVRAVGAGDDFEAKSVSGDVTLDRVGHHRVVASTVSGGLRLTGPLARGGDYLLTTTSGELTLELAGGTSFQIDARVAGAGKFITDFPLKVTEEVTRSASLHLTASHWAGGATLSLASFSGVVRLRRGRK